MHDINASEATYKATYVALRSSDIYLQVLKKKTNIKIGMFSTPLRS